MGLPRWVWMLVGIGALAVGAGFLALVGWATHRARQLDDPDHPYLGPP